MLYGTIQYRNVPKYLIEKAGLKTEVSVLVAAEPVNGVGVGDGGAWVCGAQHHKVDVGGGGA